MIIHYQIGRVLTDERLAEAERARQLSRYRRHRKNQRRTEIERNREADVIELAFGTHCGIDQTGA